MPAVPKGAPPSEPDPTAAKTPDAPAEPAGASPSPEPEAPLAGRLDPGVYEYAAPFATVYDVPLTARPADETGPATVFEWPDGAPDDNRWKPTRKKANQVPDNCVQPATTPEV